MSKKASAPMLKDLVIECQKVVSQWKELGLLLNVPQDKLNVIQTNHAGSPHAPNNCLTDMFHWWLNNGKDATYESLVPALVAVDRRDVASALCEKYGVRLHQSPSQSGISPLCHDQQPGTSGTTVLEEEDLDLLLQCVQGAAYEWRKIALGLKLKRDEIKIIERKPALIAEGPEGYFREVLEKWLEKTSPLPTIENLAVAIHSTGKERMAQGLKRKFLQKKDLHTPPMPDISAAPVPVQESKYTAAPDPVEESRKSATYLRQRARHGPHSESPSESTFNQIQPNPQRGCGQRTVLRLVLGVLFIITIVTSGYFITTSWWPPDTQTFSDSVDTAGDTIPVQTNQTTYDTVIARSEQKSTPKSSPASAPNSGCTMISTVKQALREIEDTISDWRTLGEELGINFADLDRINREQYNEKNKLKETIRMWQSRVPEEKFCWDTLINVLKSMKEIRLAKHISAKYHVKWTEE